MIVECVSNKPADFAGQAAYLSQFYHVDTVDLERGRRYTVYGIVYRAGQPWVYVITDDPACPRPVWLGFFKVIDPSVSATWRFTGGALDVGESAFLPAPWADDPAFFEKLVAETPETLREFAAIREMIDRE